MSKASKPIYKQIYNNLKNSIQNGEYQAGERIPSEKNLAEEWGVSVITPRKALDMLRSEGLIIRQAGRGSFVKDQVITEQMPNITKALIGVIMTDFDESYGIGLLNGIEREIEGKANFLFKRSFGSVDKEQQAIKEFLEIGVDGFIILPSQATYFNSAILQLIVDDYPLVLIDRYLKGLGATAVSTNNTKAAKEGTEYLFGLGHENIMLLSPPPLHAIAVEDRIEGFIQAFQSRGLVDKDLTIIKEITSTLPNSFKEPNISQDINLIKEHLKANKNITAILAIEHNVALLAKQAIIEVGLKCPEDVSVLCFDSPLVKPGAFTFTHILQDQENMGKTAVSELLKSISSPSKKQTILLDALLIEGQSTRKINTAKNTRR